MDRTESFYKIDRLLTQLERERQAGEFAIEFNADPRLEAMRLRGEQHEARYVERLRAEGREVCDLRGAKDPAVTREAMQRGCDVIVVANPKHFEPECRTPEQMRWVNGMCRYRELAVRACTGSRIPCRR